ncbi:MAG: LytR/AlgR family response regulator transcription factor [Crocinitomicaceae bacterium]|jgi:two-component system LytT family response regulator
MKTIKTIIIDDERLAREELKSLLLDFIEIEIVDEAQNGQEGIEKIMQHKPDLIFLDVSMPGMTGFEMLKQLDDVPQVIFVTAFDEHALKAFDLQAIDYILKPIDPERLSQAIKKVSIENAEIDNFDFSARENKLLDPQDKVFIKDGEKCWFIELNRVRMMESDGNYVKVYFDQFRPMVLRSLNNFETRLNPEYFFRANRKFIINLNHVVAIETWFNGGLKVELSKGEKIEISRRQAIRFKEVFSI